MNFACDHCQRRYSIPDEKVRGKVVRVRCRNCQNPILLRGEGSDPPTPTGVRPAPIRSPQGEWYVMIKGQQVGPLPENTFRSRVDEGEITPRSFVWRKGMAEWQRAESVDVLRPVFGLSPADLPSAQPAKPAPAATIAATPSSVRRQVAAEQQKNAGPSWAPGPALEPGPTVAPTPALAGELSQVPTGPEFIQNPHPARRTQTQDFLFSELDALQQPGETREAPMGDIPIGSAPTDPSDVTLASIGSIRPSYGDLEGAGTAQFPDMLENERKGPFRTFVKVVLTLVTLVALVSVGLILLGLIPLDITRTDAEGREVRESVFARGILPGLEDLFSGKTLELPASPLPGADSSADAGASGLPPGATPEPPSTAATNEPSKEPSLADSGPAGAIPSESSDAGLEAGAVTDPATDVPAAEEERMDEETPNAAADVSPPQAALDACVQAERERNPDFRPANQKAYVRIGPEGTVAAVRLEDAAVDTSPLGECLKAAVRPLIFEKSEEAEAERELPLSLETVP